MTVTSPADAPLADPAFADAPASRADPLFAPYDLGDLTLPNRIVMAPMTRSRAAPGGLAREITATYYAQRSSAGLIVAEAAQVSPQGVGYPGTPGIYSPAQIEAWRRVTSAVHEAGGRIFLQLFHAGRISHPSLQPGGIRPVAPTAAAPLGNAMTPDGPQPFVTPRALEAEEIPLVVEEFRQAALNALAAGFDGVEIHGANGYLLDQFLRDGTNRRQDAYGGSIEKRLRLPLEVASAVAGAVGAGRTGFRISPVNGFNDIADSGPDALFTALAREASGLDLAYLHVVENGLPGPLGPQRFDRRSLARAFEGTYIANGGYDRLRADWALASGAADLIAFGQAFIANPDLPIRLRDRLALADAEPAAIYGGGAAGYIDYPAAAPRPPAAARTSGAQGTYPLGTL